MDKASQKSAISVVPKNYPKLKCWTMKRPEAGSIKEMTTPRSAHAARDPTGKFRWDPGELPRSAEERFR